MRTINQRQQDKQKKIIEKPTTRQCKYEHHEGDRTLLVSEFYQRQSFCKKCMVKYNKKKRNKELDKRIRTQYAGVDCVLNNIEALKDSPRLFKSGLIAEAKIIENFKNTGVRVECYPKNVSEYYPPALISNQHYIYFLNARFSLDICKYLIVPKDKQALIYIYGDVNEKWLPYITEAATKYQFDVGFITDEID